MRDGSRTGRVTMTGPACFSSNWIYRRKRMPRLEPGDVLAILDAVTDAALDALADLPAEIWRTD